jgi:bifunctional UDP-N-acetylglucosamine pyrophosphorylase/glucosamine-1-phosphate N-acetyltransferase
MDNEGRPRDTAAVVLAAGKGTRMKTDTAKVLVPLKGEPMVRHVIEACRSAGVGRIILVVGYKAGEVQATLGLEFEYVIQKEQLGTAHALIQARDLLRGFDGDLLVLPGDAPFITAGFLDALLAFHRASGADATMASVVWESPPPYGRILRDASGRVIRVVEEWDAGPEVKAVKETCTSHYVFRAGAVLPLLSEIRNDNAKKEYYLTDIVEVLARRGLRVETFPVPDPKLVLGINTVEELEQGA